MTTAVYHIENEHKYKNDTKYLQEAATEIQEWYTPNEKLNCVVQEEENAPTTKRRK